MLDGLPRPLSWLVIKSKLNQATYVILFVITNMLKVKLSIYSFGQQNALLGAPQKKTYCVALWKWTRYKDSQ